MSKIVFVGCGSANLFAALYLMDNGFNPRDITIIDSGSEPETRTSMLKGFAGAGLKSDGKFVFSLFEDPTSKHIDEQSRVGYHKIIQDLMMRFVEIPQTGISKICPEDKLDDYMYGVDALWGLDNLTLRQSEVWHIGTDTELVMAINMYKYMVAEGVDFMMKTTVTDIDFGDKRISYIRSDRKSGVLEYDYVQIGAGKVGVPFVDMLINRYNILKDPGYANVGGRFETKCSDTIKKFADEIQYDFKFLKEYNDGKMQIRTFCTCNYSAYVMEEGINGKRTYNGHAYGKNHEKENGMTNFGVMARIKDIDAPAFHNAVLSKYGKEGCVLRGHNWDGTSTIEKVGKVIGWDGLFELYKDLPDGHVLVNNLRNFIERMDTIFHINGNWSYYIPEIKMAVGVIDTDSRYRLSDGRYPEATWVGDSCTGSVGIVPAAITGMRAVDHFIGK